MFEIKYIDTAIKDLEEIINYIRNVLKNEKAALSFIKDFDKQIKTIKVFPHASSVYYPISSLKQQYRSAKVKNYILFYTIDYDKKIITIIRVLYQKQNIDKVVI